MNKKYYAIKIGRKVKNLIIDNWEECKKYTLGYPSIYKSFKNKKEAKKYLKSMTEEEIDITLRINEMHRLCRVRQEFQNKYDFIIPIYIIDEIINRNDYENLCALIDLAVLNNRITEEQGNILKKDNPCNNN